jgi:beta-glucosidase
VAATWDRNLAYARGQGIGEEHRSKGVDVVLGPVCGPLGRAPEGGRNWVRKPGNQMISQILTQTRKVSVPTRISQAL